MDEEINKLKIPKGWGDSVQSVSVPPEKAKNTIVLMSKFSPVPYAKYLMKNYKFLFDNFKRFWRYDTEQGIWKEDGEMFIRNQLRIKLMGEEQQKKNYADEVVNYIKDVCWTEENVSNPPENIIAFENCLFDIDTETILDFSSDYFITNKIPVVIDSQYNECPKIDQFFEDCVGRDKKNVLFELMAYCMLRSYPYQKFFILYGKGCNGKSVFLNLIRKFLGSANVSNETPQNLVTNKFSRGNLWNKLANIGSDIPYVSLSNTNIIKELTGEDYGSCERKFKEAFPFKNYAKLIWSANELPQVNDKTYAFYRRVYIVGFGNMIKDPDPNILNKITNGEELSGLGWTLIKKIRELKGKNFVFTWNPDAKEMEQMYEDLSNPLNRFLREHCKESNGGKLLKYEFRDRFIAWLRENGFRIWSEKEVGAVMKERYHEGRKVVEENVVNDQGQLENQIRHYRCWEGLDWIEPTK